jgi:hypothetical protein
MLEEEVLRKTCVGCSKRIILTNKLHKSNWIGLCRDCKYIMDIFALNGNRLEEYQ